MFYEKYPIDKRRVRYGNTFYLRGVFRKRKRPKLYLKIFHNCVESNFVGKRKTAITKILTLRVPDQYVGKGTWPSSLYFMGEMDLAQINRNE
uniref:Transthyretin-like family protein n=1 Tax=Strongyloides papillosus TaxID=174720 RepID=A0A0N5BRK1_STREA